MLFQGQDFLEDRWFDDRRYLSWDKSHRYSCFLHLARDLIQLRRNTARATRGLSGRQCRVLRVDEHRKLLAYPRFENGGPGDDTVVIVNASTHPVAGYRLGLPRPGAWRLRVDTDARRYGDGFGALPAGDVVTSDGWVDGCPQHADFSLGPYAALIYSPVSYTHLLRAEPLRERLLGLHAGPHHLDRDGTLQHLILRAPHVAHAPGGDPGSEGVAAAQHRPLVQPVHGTSTTSAAGPSPPWLSRRDRTASMVPRRRRAARRIGTGGNRGKRRSAGVRGTGVGTQRPSRRGPRRPPYPPRRCV